MIQERLVKISGLWKSLLLSYNVNPQNVIGVATLLKNDTQLTTSRKEIKDNNYDQKQNLNLKFTSNLWAPQAMFVRKYGAILTYINQWKMPIVVAGDTPTSDGYMMFHVYNQQGGTVRLWINRKNTYLTLIKQMKDQYVREQKENNLTVTADKNWIYLTPNELAPTNVISSTATATSGSVSLMVATTTTQHSANDRNDATNHRYRVLVSLISLFITYF